MTLAIQIGWLALLAGLEMLFGQWETVVRGVRRKARNLGFAVVNHLVIPGVVVTVTYLLGPLVGWPGVAALPTWAGLALTIVVLDLVGYWFHRVSHRNLFLWRFHQIHHLDEDFDASTGARVHTVEELMHQALLAAVTILIGAPAWFYTVFATASFVMAIFHHANIRIPERLDLVLRAVLFTPSLHVPHHNEDIAHTDTNFGFIFPWWDLAFGTYNSTRRTADWRIGLDYSHDLGFGALMVQPFIPTQLKESATAPVRTTVREEV